MVDDLGFGLAREAEVRVEIEGVEFAVVDVERSGVLHVANDDVVPAVEAEEGGDHALADLAEPTNEEVATGALDLVRQRASC